MHFISSYRLQRDNPICPPSWRFQWAQTVVGQGRPWPDDIDHAALTALRLARHLESQGSAAANDDTDGRLIAALAALRIHRGNAQQRTLLEAWILSGEVDSTIGLRLGLEPEVVDAFEILFFNVRHRLRAADWIIVGVIGWPIGPDGHRDIAMTVKLLAYVGGPFVLDVVLGALGMSSALGAGHPLHAVDENLANRVRLLVDVVCNPPRGRMAIRMWDQIREIEDRRLQPVGGCLQQSPLDLSVASALDGVDRPAFGAPDEEALCEPAIATVA